MTTLRRATCNLDHNAPNPGRIVSKVLMLADVVGWQEVRDLDQRRALKGLNPKWWRTYWPGGAGDLVPITWDARRYRLVASGSMRVHPGVKGITPARVIVWVVLTDIATGRRVAHVNTHFIQGRQNYRWRRPLWALHLKMLNARVAWLRKTYGCAVVVGGDWNAQNARLSNARMVVPDRPTKDTTTVDYFAVAGPVRVGTVTTHSVGSDHSAVAVELHPTIPTTPPKPPTKEQPMKFVSKEEWGSTLGRQATRRTHPIGKTHGVTLHWEGPHMGTFPHSRCAEKVRGIERFHEQTRGWADLAYNGVICPHGYVFEGRGAGVQSAANGNSDDNDDWYALCYLGGEGDGFTEEGKQGFLDAVHWLRTKGGAGPRVNGHRDHKATACPGGLIYAWLQTADFNTPVTPPKKETEMNAQQEKMLAMTLDAAQRAVIRGNVNTRLMQRLAQETKVDISDLSKEIAACDAQDKAAQ
mgnify:CR=1 FL=1